MALTRAQVRMVRETRQPPIGLVTRSTSVPLVAEVARATASALGHKLEPPGDHT